MQLLEGTREQIVQTLPGVRTPVSLRSGQTKLDGSLNVLGLHKFGVLVIGQGIEDSRDKAASILGVGLHVTHNHLHGYIGSRLVPAVVVSRHTDHLVGDFGFARELGLGETRHVDDGATPRTIHVTLSAGRELRPLCKALITNGFHRLTIDTYPCR